jgi:hypothetical protein
MNFDNRELTCIPQDCQKPTKTQPFRKGENKNDLTKNYQYSTNGIVLSDSNGSETDLSSSQKLCLNFPQSIIESHPLAVTSAAKSMFEIVVGDTKELNPKTSDRVFWENSAVDLRHLPGYLEN